MIKFIFITFLFGASVNALSKELSRESVEVEGFRYIYIKNSGSRYPTGEIVIEIVGTDETRFRQTNLAAPGCYKFPAITILEYGKYKRKVSVFCGDGKVVLVDPVLGVLDTVKFYRDQVNLKVDSLGRLFFYVMEEYSPLNNNLTGIRYSNKYPVVYVMSGNSRLKNFVELQERPESKIFKGIYKEFLRRFEKENDLGLVLSLLVSGKKGLNTVDYDYLKTKVLKGIDIKLAERYDQAVLDLVEGIKE